MTEQLFPEFIETPHGPAPDFSGHANSLAPDARDFFSRIISGDHAYSFDQIQNHPLTAACLDSGSLSAEEVRQFMMAVTQLQNMVEGSLDSDNEDEDDDEVRETPH